MWGFIIGISVVLFPSYELSDCKVLGIRTSDFICGDILLITLLLLSPLLFFLQWFPLNTPWYLHIIFSGIIWGLIVEALVNIVRMMSKNISTHHRKDPPTPNPSPS
jgi:Na+-driven multidrug efflux pump